MNLFLQVNLLLALTGLLYVVFEKLLARLHVRIAYAKTLRFAQVLFAVSLLLPVLLKGVPLKTIRGVESPVFQAYSEGMDTPIVVEPLSQVHSLPREVFIPAHTPDFAVDLNSLLACILFIGICFFLLRFMRIYVRLMRNLSAAIVLKRHGRIKIVASSEVFVPFSVALHDGLWIVLPESLLSDKIDRDLAIKHEMQHHRQGDTRWTMLMEFIGCFLFFNPAMYLWKNIITELQEFSCDESLTGQNEVCSKDYGSCLLRVAEAALEHRQMYAGTTSMAAIIRDSNYFKKFLRRRIEMITEEKLTRRTWVARSVGIFTIVTAVTAAIGAEKLVRGKINVNPGSLMVDQDVQKITDDVLTRALKRMKATAGFIIVAEPGTGRILAVSNMDLKGKRKGHWVLNELMETASITKPLVVAEALEEGKTDVASKHNCENGQYSYNGAIYKDWKTGGWPSLTTAEVLEVSSNICMIKIGQVVGEAGLENMLEKFGFGDGGTAQHFPQARPGERPERGPQYIPQVTSGFGFKSNPLEIVQAYGAIINGGTLMEPISSDGKSTALRKLISEENSKKMRELLQNVVLHGTGRNAKSDLYTTAGKTATSFLNDFIIIDGNGSKDMANYAGFIGFAPVTKPTIEVYVGLMNPNMGHTGAQGGSHAAPVFKEVVENVLTHLKIAPDKI